MIVYIHIAGQKCKKRNLVEGTILSSNETKANINKIIDDILNPKTALVPNKDLFEKSFLRH